MTDEMIDVIQRNVNCDVYEGYSGRGMYGAETNGLVFQDYNDALEANKVVAIEDYRENHDATEMDDEEVLEELIEYRDFDPSKVSHFKLDNLGMNYIGY
jgi:beta-mannanase